jgi:hypothetical protein
MDFRFIEESGMRVSSRSAKRGTTSTGAFIRGIVMIKIINREAEKELYYNYVNECGN